MEYEGRICRAPAEKGSFMLPVAVGCAYNRCKFCGLFKDLTYREIPLEDIEKELKRVSGLGGNPARVYLGDGNAFHIADEKLFKILEMVHKYFPGCEEIRMDSTVPDIASKSDEALEKYAALKVKRLYLGIESGLEDVLRFQNKCHTKEMAYTQIERLHKYGIEYAAHIMTGVAGKGRGIEDARAMAEFLNITKPALVVNFSIFTHNLVPDIEAGTFVPASETENMEQAIELIKLLDVPGLVFDGFHDDKSVQLRVFGTLPQDRDKMIKQLQDGIEKLK